MYNDFGLLCKVKAELLTFNSLVCVMAIGVVEFSREGYKIRKVFA